MKFWLLLFLFAPLVSSGVDVIATTWARSFLLSISPADARNRLQITNSVGSTGFTNGQVTVLASSTLAYYTNTLISTNWHALATVNSPDATAFSARAIPGSGFLTIEVNTAATADTIVTWLLIPGVYIAVVADFLEGQDGSALLGQDGVQLMPQ